MLNFERLYFGIQCEPIRRRNLHIAVMRHFLWVVKLKFFIIGEFEH
jgi:hypothetical protein